MLNLIMVIITIIIIVIVIIIVIILFILIAIDIFSIISDKLKNCFCASPSNHANYWLNFRPRGHDLSLPSVKKTFKMASMRELSISRPK